MNEKRLLDQIRIDHTPRGRLFRNNVGTGWTGKTTRLPDGVLIKNARPLRAGLVRGSSDLVGWTIREITPEMVGERIAVFTAVEVKTGKVQVTKEQKRFLEAVASAGGIAVVAREAPGASHLYKWEVEE